MKRKAFILFAVTSLGLLASGSYPGKPGKPPRTPDVNRYQLGKAIFTGKKKLAAADDARKEAQSATIAKIESKLPAKVKRKYSVTGFAGKLSDKEMGALIYYLGVRYRIKGLK